MRGAISACCTLAWLVALLACKQFGESDGTTGQESGTASPASTERPRPSTPAARPKPGPAYIAYRRQGLAMIDESGASLLLDLGYGDWIRDLNRGGDGAIWVASHSGIRRIVGSQVTQLWDEPVKQVSAASENEAYAIDGHHNLYEYDGKSWTVHTTSQTFARLLARPASWVDDVDLAAPGDLWVSNPMEALRREGSSWQAVDTAKLGTGIGKLRHLTHDRHGTRFAATPAGVFLRREGEWRELHVGGSPHRVAASSFGFVAASFDQRLAPNRVRLVAPIDGSVEFDLAQRGIVPKDLAIDDSGRFWVATWHGIAVFDPRGKNLVYWPPTTLNGIHGQATHVVVVGSGPTRLPAPVAPHTGTIKGRIKDGKVVVANTEFSICNYVLDGPGHGNPCTNAAVHLRGKTDDRGRFTVSGIPIGGKYQIAHPLPNGKWTWTLFPGRSCCEDTHTFKRGVYELGDV